MDLHLYEEVLLLALDDDSGKADATTLYTYALSAAVLGELLLGGQARLEGEGKQARVAPTGAAPSACPVAEDAYARIREDAKPRAPGHWISTLVNANDLVGRVAARLVGRGVLERVDAKVLWVFSSRRYPARDPGPERALRTRLAAAIESDGPIDERTALLVSLLHPTGLLKTALGKDVTKRRAARIESILAGSALGASTKEVVETAQFVLAMTILNPGLYVVATSD